MPNGQQPAHRETVEHGISIWWLGALAVENIILFLLLAAFQTWWMTRSVERLEARMDNYYANTVSVIRQHEALPGHPSLWERTNALSERLRALEGLVRRPSP